MSCSKMYLLSWALGLFCVAGCTPDEPDEAPTDTRRQAQLSGGPGVSVFDFVVNSERIGTVLDAKLAEAEEPVEVWQIPLSVFNWLVDTPTGEGFVHGALKAWSSAENFNAANAAQCDEAQRAKLRAPFLELAPLRLRAVLEELLATGLVVTFAEKFVGPELKYLVMRVQSPVEERKRR